MPTPASAAMSWGRTACPLERMTSPFLISSPVWITFSSGATGFTTSMLPASTGCVCSNITTASAPRGRAPPVAIFMISPFAMPRSGMEPMGMSPTRRRSTGRDSAAPKVSELPAAYPSTVERSNSGRSMGEMTTVAVTLPRAQLISTSSVAGAETTRCSFRTLSASSLDTTPLRPSMSLMAMVIPSAECKMQNLKNSRFSFCLLPFALYSISPPPLP